MLNISIHLIAASEFDLSSSSGVVPNNSSNGGVRVGGRSSVVLPRNPNSGEFNSSDEASTSEQSDSRRHSIQEDEEQV